MNQRKTPWLSSVAASPTIISELQSAVGELPSSYIELLRQGNGGEVGLQVDPYNLCLDTAEEALNYWNSGTYPIKGVFIFGGDGGGTLLALDMRNPGKPPVISFDPIDPEGSTAHVSADFDELLALVTHSPNR